MVKKIILLTVFFMSVSSEAFAFEFGVTGGIMSKSSSNFNYGIAGGTGFMIPMLKFEFEFYKMKGAEPPDRPSVITAGIKFRPKFGKLTPYGIIGVGGEFEYLTFNFGKYDKFTFIGGGAHLFFSDMISIRADIRFLNFSASNRIRFSGGIFFHL
jgi:hypothetical protein